MRKWMLFLCIFTMLVFNLTGCSTAVSEPCDWCDGKPSMAYKTSDGTDAYVCRDCSSKCMLCDAKGAKKHYENLLGMIVFVCDDCYDEVAED